MRAVRRCSAIILLLVFVLCAAILVQAKDDWQPVSKDELSLKDVPENPGAHAVALYRSDDRNDQLGYNEMYFRIKVLTEEGKKYANVETPSYPDVIYQIEDIKARTIRPDGTVVPFQGKIFEKLIAKYKGYRVVAKTFTMPDVQVGSIIEYKYRQKFSTYIALDVGNRWQIQDELFTRKAHFSFMPGPGGLSWIHSGLPAGKVPAQQKDHSITLDLENIAAFEKEPFMPPEAESRAYVHFYYTGDFVPKTADEYWQKEGKAWRKLAEDFMDKRGAMQKEVTAVLKPEDTTTEGKMRRLYERVQSIRNLTYERDKTEKEEKKENLKDNNHVEDVLRHGYGYHNSINRLYVALLRAAGIEASLIRVCERDDRFFHRNVPQWSQLSSELVVVRDGKNTIYLDPGTKYCPYGVLPWEDTGVEGLLMDNSGTSFSKTPNPVADNALTNRKAQFQIDREGTLKGTLQLTFTGLEALHRRLVAREDDDTERKKGLEEEVKGWFPAGATIELAKMEGWNSSNAPLVANFNVTVPNFGAVTGKRILLPTSVFQGQDRHPFQHGKRLAPVYFRFPFREVDDVSITLPEQTQVESVPAPRPVQSAFAQYSMRVEKQENRLDIKRNFQMDGLMFRTEYYPHLQQFYNLVKAADDEQAVLRAYNAQGK